MLERGEAKIHIEAPPDRVYDLISDVTRMGEWSPETYECEWLEGATGPAVGAKFKGKNKQGVMKWSTTPEVAVAERGKEFAFVTKSGGRDGTIWRYQLKAAGGGTDVTESWEAVWTPLFLKPLNRILRRDQKLAQGMQTTLERLKAAAEAS